MSSFEPKPSDRPGSESERMDWEDVAADKSVRRLEEDSSAHLTLLTLLCLSAAFAYICRSCLGVVSDQVQRDLGIQTTAMGWAMSAFFWSYAVGQIPAAWLGHVWGSRRALTFYATIWSLGCASIAFSQGLWSLVMAQSALGLAQAGLFPCAAATISRWMPPGRRAMASGALASCMSLGGAMGVALAGALQMQFGWKAVFVLAAVPGLFWALGFYKWFRDSPADHPQVSEAELRRIRAGKTEPDPKVPPRRDPTRPGTAAGSSPNEPEAGTPWGRVLTHPDMWWICGQQFFRAAGYVFYATWFPKYLKETRGVTTAQSGLLSSLPLLAVVLGATLGGLLIDWVLKRTGSKRRSRQWIAVTSMSACAMFILFAYFVSSAIGAVLLITVGSLFAAIGGPCGYAVTIDKGGSFVGPIFGLMNMCGNLGAAACPIVVPYVVAKNDGNWNSALLLFVGIYACAAFCWMLLNPDGTVTGEDSDSPSKQESP